MRYRKEIMTAAGTLTCALGIGFFMQSSGEAPKAGYEGVALTNADASVLSVEDIVLTAASFDQEVTAPVAEQDVAQPTAQEIGTPQEQTLPSLPPEVALVQTVSLDATDNVLSDPAVDEDTLLADSCEVSANARPIAAAMVNLTVSASCLPNERVTVHHAGLLFGQVTDDQGNLDITLPALTQEAVFIVAFSDGEGAVAQTPVEELADFDRVALQWKGDTGFQLHALEFGAEYDSEGHVWAGAPGEITAAVTGDGGFISVLGDTSVPDALMAEVYTFPAGVSRNAGRIHLSVEAEVVENNCSLEIEAQTLQMNSGNDITTKDLTLSVPDCDASGNFLVLNNLFEDLKVASR